MLTENQNKWEERENQELEKPRKPLVEKIVSETSSWNIIGWFFIVMTLLPIFVFMLFLFLLLVISIVSLIVAWSVTT